MLKNIFYPGNYAANINYALLFFRIFVGILIFTHGIGKFQMLTGDAPITFADPIGIGQTASLFLSTLAEFFSAIFLVLGLASRPAAFILVINMAVIFFIVHAGDPFNAKELPLLFLISFFTLLITGAGKFSLDRLVYNKLNKNE